MTEREAYGCFLTTCMILKLAPISFEEWKALSDEFNKPKGVQEWLKNS